MMGPVNDKMMPWKPNKLIIEGIPQVIFCPMFQVSGLPSKDEMMHEKI